MNRSVKYSVSCADLFPELINIYDPLRSFCILFCFNHDDLHFSRVSHSYSFPAIHSANCCL